MLIVFRVKMQHDVCNLPKFSFVTSEPSYRLYGDTFELERHE